MNWPQLYNAFTPEERDDITMLMMQLKEIRNEQRLRARTDSIRRAKGKPRDERLELLNWAHFVGVHRGLNRAERNLYRSLFLFILITVSLTIWLIALHVPVSLGAPLVFGYDLFLWALVSFRPFRLKRWIPNI